MEKFARWEKAGEGSWTRLQEVDGRLVDEVATLAAKGERERKRYGEELEEEEGVYQRGLIRQVVLIVDASRAALTTDMRPTRLGATIAAACDFVEAFFATNPVSSLAVLKAQDGAAARLSRLSGSKRAHVEALKSLSARPHFPPSGDFSLAAALEEARFVLAKTPDYGRREILLIVSSLATRDGEDLFKKTAKRLKALSVAVNVVSLSAETAVFKTLASKSDGGSFTVALDRAHFNRLLDAHVPPPKLALKKNTSETKQEESEKKGPPPLIEMGFPTLRVDSVYPKVCAMSDAKHDRGTLTLEWNATTFSCPKCMTRVASLPCSCPVCDLPLVSAPHLAASYHHLFPVPRFVEIDLNALSTTQRENTTPNNKKQKLMDNLLLDDNDDETPRAKKGDWKEQQQDRERRISQHVSSSFLAHPQAPLACFGCLDPLWEPPTPEEPITRAFVYVCPKCETPFCASCDEYIHTSLHNCPACHETAAASTISALGSRTLAAAS